MKNVESPKHSGIATKLAVGSHQTSTFCDKESLHSLESSTYN